MQNVAQHEAELTSYALPLLKEIPRLRIFGDADPELAAERLGVIPLEIQGMSHFKVASILGYEYGIGVRSGCFCAHPYILHLLGLKPEDARQVRQHILDSDRSEMPGLIRVSFGLYNSFQDVDALVKALAAIAGEEYKGEYIQDRANGEYRPKDWAPDFEQYFSLDTAG